MALVTCQKCAGLGTVVGEPAPPYPDLRPIRYDEDVTTRRWYPCPTCQGVGTLPEFQRAEVWTRVAEAGIVIRDPELRTEGDLDPDA